MKPSPLSSCAFLACLAALAFPLGTVRADDGWVGGPSWLTSTNWLGFQTPGSTSSTTNTDIAFFSDSGTDVAGINATTYYLGAIVLSGTANHTVGYQGANFAGISLSLGGRTVNGVANTILRNSGSGILNLSNQSAGFDGIVLRNTDNVINIDGTGGITFGSASISGDGKNLTFNATGTGILTLGGTSYSGSTLINGGTLKAGPDALSATSSVMVTNGGTLLLANAGLGAVNDAASITLGVASGLGQASSISRAGLGSGSGNEGTGSAAGMGALTLTGNAALNFGGAGTVNGTMTFGGATAFNPAAFTLRVLNYDGKTGGTAGVDGTNDRLIFASDQAANLSHFAFVDPNGTTGTVAGTEIALGGGFFEVTPAPEPDARIFGGLGLAVLLSLYRSRRPRLAVRL